MGVSIAQQMGKALALTIQGRGLGGMVELPEVRKSCPGGMQAEGWRGIPSRDCCWDKAGMLGAGAGAWAEPCTEI